MSFTKTEFVTRTGRIVFTGGDKNSLYEPKTTDFDGNPLVYKSGDNVGGAREEFLLGLAIAKLPGEAHWGTSQEGAIIWAQGHKDHPQSAQRPDFAWKVTDGDSTTPGKGKKGKPGRRPCDKEGFAGHWVYTFSSGQPFRFVDAKGAAYILEKDAVKVGDYVQVAGNVVGNTGATPGVYLNHAFVSLQGRGEAIVSGPDLKTLAGQFGNGPAPAAMQPAVFTPPASLPPVPGATPPAPGATPVPPAAVAPVPAATPAIPSATPTPAATPAVPTGVTPNSGFLNGGAPGAPVAPAAPAVPAAPPAGPTMTAKAGTTPWSDFVAKGWTEEMARTNGYIV